MKTLEDEWYGVITAYKLAVLEIEKFACISIYCVSALSLHIESTDSMIYYMSMHCMGFPPNSLYVQLTPGSH